jgi:hypothetical protein
MGISIGIFHYHSNINGDLPYQWGFSMGISMGILQLAIFDRRYQYVSISDRVEKKVALCDYETLQNRALPIFDTSHLFRLVSI